jgi:RanGTP-binding protein
MLLLSPLRSRDKLAFVLRVLSRLYCKRLPNFRILLRRWQRTISNMDFFLDKVTSQAMNYAIRSGLGIAAGYAIKQSNKLLTNAPKSGVRDELFSLQQRIEHKIRIISPAIDMIDLIAARGNTSLESAIALTKELRQDIHAIGQRLAQAATTSAKSSRVSKVSIHAKTEQEVEMRFIVVDMKKLLERLEDALPLISLAITTSGVTLSTSLPHTVSPSRLLQASTLLTAGDTQYTITPRQAVQIGPTFSLTVYMLFAGHDRPQNEEELRETTWKEVIHKARVKLRRVPLDVVAGTGSGSEALPSADIRSPTSDPVNADIPAVRRIRIPAHDHRRLRRRPYA